MILTIPQKMHNPALIFVALGDILTNCTGVGIPNTSIDIGHGHPKHLQVNPKFQIIEHRRVHLKAKHIHKSTNE